MSVARTASPGAHDHHGSAPSDPGATLREVESLIVSLGGPSPALQHGSAQQRATATSAPRAVAARAAAGKDCLDVERKTAAALNHRSVQRSIAGTPSMMRGACMAGRDRAEKRYIGKGFQPPPAESPGPIYRPPPGFAEDSVVANSGFSFSRAPRSSDGGASPHAASTPGPNSYATPTTVGRQSVSTYKSATSATFSHGPRVNERVFLSAAHSKNMHATDAPAPNEYLDVYKPPQTGRRAPAALLLSSRESSSKAFISKAHVVDSVGRDTANADMGGPINTKADSRYASSPAFSFGSSKRNGVDAAASPDISVASDDKAMTRERRRQLALQTALAAKSATPGPGEYAPRAPSQAERGPAAIIPAVGKTDKLFWSKELSTRKGEDSPGMRYNPTTTACDRHSPAATIARPRGSDPHATHDRFSEKQFIGKAFDGGKGSASPGPVYDVPPPKLEGPAYTMCGKEPTFERKVVPGPSRPRWVSRESAKDNMGAYGPGPKYDTRSDFSKGGLKYSFGSAPRSSSAEPSAAAAKEAAAAAAASKSGRPPRSQSALDASRDSAGARSPSPRQHVPGPKLVAPSNHARASPRQQQQDARQATAAPVVPKYETSEPAAPKVGFPLAPRFGPRQTMGLRGMGPGPSYNPNYRLIEPRVPGGSFGGLP